MLEVIATIIFPGQNINNNFAIIFVSEDKVTYCMTQFRMCLLFFFTFYTASAAVNMYIMTGTN